MSSNSTIVAGSSKYAAIVTMCAGVLFLATNDAVVKWLVTRYDPFQIVFVRSLIALPIIVALVCLIESPKALRSARLPIHALRGVLGVGASFAFIFSLRTLPLAEATALVFASPLVVAALSAPLLKEHVGWARTAAIVVGFIGVLIIVQPGAATFQVASLLAVGASFLYALVMVSARWIDKRDSIWTMMLYMTVFAAVLSAFTVFTVWPTPEFTDLFLFLGTAVAGTLGLTLISQAFRMAPAAVVAPYDYTALIWASLLGWLIWGVVPEIWTYVGASVIIAAGIYLIYSEPKV
ncbi:MAG: EamA family transporter [Alphaproteobacteria bacterium]|nr:EamA family transporter [Alphaproteobacteria bacterium]